MMKPLRTNIALPAAEGLGIFLLKFESVGLCAYE
jgi:hypothetical protein